MIRTSEDIIHLNNVCNLNLCSICTSALQVAVGASNSIQMSQHLLFNAILKRLVAEHHSFQSTVIVAERNLKYLLFYIFDKTAILPKNLMLTIYMQCGLQCNVEVTCSI